MKKKMFIVITLLVLLFSFPALGDPADTLTLYVFENPFMVPLIDSALVQFKAQYPNVHVNLQRYKGFTFEDEYSKVLNTELMAGKGPDVILFSEYTFLDINKVMQTGVFADLTAYEETLGLKDSRYVQAVMDGGKVGESRLFVPLYYQAPLLLTTDALVSAADIEEMNQTDFWAFMERLVEQKEGMPDTKYFSDYWGSSIISLLKASGISFADYQQAASAINMTDVKRLADALKAVYQSDYVETTGRIYSTLAYNDLHDHDCLYAYMSMIDDCLFTASALGGAGSTPYTTFIPSIEGGVHANICYGAAVNSNSASKEWAVAFIKELLSSVAQQEEDEFFYFPVNTEGFTELIDKKAGEISGIGIDRNMGWLYSAIPDDVMNSIKNVPERITRASVVNAQVNYYMFYQDMLPYLSDEKPLEACMNEFSNKLSLYISE